MHALALPTNVQFFTSRRSFDRRLFFATGDAYRYTIQPVFENIKNEHACHIRRQPAAVLYELFYFVQIPGTSFQTARVYKTVYQPDVGGDRGDETGDGGGYVSRGENRADFLTVEHSAGLSPHDEFVLVGNEVETAAGVDRINYTLHTLRPTTSNDDDGVPYRATAAAAARGGANRRITIHEISPRIFVASAHFERPFDYSTSTWTRSAEPCVKNVSKIKAAVARDETYYQDVNVVIQNGGDPFRYFLKSIDNPPYIRFNVPGSRL